MSTWLLYLAVLVPALAQAGTPAFSRLYEFPARGSGHSPGGPLVRDRNGVLYGVASGDKQHQGIIFSLTPPSISGGTWTESVLYEFPFNHGYPNAPLLLGLDGSLYGTTSLGGIRYGGTAFRLRPPATSGAAWTHRVIHAFGLGTDGNSPFAGLTFGQHGEFYGTTNGGGLSQGCRYCGTVFMLSPPSQGSGIWSETVLYRFDGNKNHDAYNPQSPVVIGSDGTVYGTTASGGDTFAEGTVYALTPPASPGGTWTETILHTFGSSMHDGTNPNNVVVDTDGSLYGTTDSGEGNGVYGTIFKMTPPRVSGGPWRDTILYTFTGQEDGGEPITGVVIGENGVLYGVTSRDGFRDGARARGTAYRLTPPSAAGDPWTFNLLHTFRWSPGGIIRDEKGVLYGTAWAGGAGPCKYGHAVVGCGVVFQYEPQGSVPNLGSH